MIYKQLILMLNETGLSPEKLAGRLGISNLTYRRWLKKPPGQHIPKKYERGIAGGIHQLLGEGKLKPDSPIVGDFLEHHLPEFFQAAIGQFQISQELFSEKSDHQDKITCILLHVGNNAKARDRVEAEMAGIRKFAEWGSAWKERTTLLIKTVRSKELSLVDKLIAYGALFYLVLPFDLIPDTIPVFGYVDDFGILGFAAAYYLKKYPQIFGGNNAAESIV